MPKTVRYDEFGGIDVLRVEEVERPVPGDGQASQAELVLVEAGNLTAKPEKVSWETAGGVNAFIDTHGKIVLRP